MKQEDNFAFAVTEGLIEPGFAFKMILEQGTVVDAIKMFYALFLRQGYNEDSKKDISIRSNGNLALKMDKSTALTLLSEKTAKEGSVAEMAFFQAFIIRQDYDDIMKVNESFGTDDITSKMKDEYDEGLSRLIYLNEIRPAIGDMGSLRFLLQSKGLGIKSDPKTGENVDDLIDKLYQKLAFNSNGDIVAAFVANFMYSKNNSSELSVNQPYNKIPLTDFVRKIKELNDYLFNGRELVYIIHQKTEAGLVHESAMKLIEQHHPMLMNEVMGSMPSTEKIESNQNNQPVM